MPHRSAHASTAPAVDWLNRDPDGAQLLHTAHTLLRLQRALAKSLPTALGRRARVARLQDRVVTVVVPSPAHAARLRQLTAGVSRQLRLAGWDIEGIIVRTDFRGAPDGTNKTRRETEPLGEQALASFESLGQAVSPGPLADAIQRLIQRHRG